MIAEDLHIWRYEIDEKEYHLEREDPLMSRHEKKRCDEYLHPAEKIRYTCNHRFVRRVLSRYMSVPPGDIKFSHGAKGKPFVEDSDLFFNYSYRGDLGILAISSRSEVGVDIEKMRTLRDLVTFADFSFSEKEKEIIFGSAEELFDDTLFTFWTFKEAIIKALGVGLNADLTQIDLSGFFYDPSTRLGFDRDQLYTIQSIAAPEGHKAAFAIKGQINSYREFNFPEDF